MKNLTYKPTVRAKIIERRTYNRPLNDEGTVFETWEQTVNRVIGHQRWLWERAKGSELDLSEKGELEFLRGLMLERKLSTSGRTLWLGGTDVAKKREASQFNCSFTQVETVYDVVDVLWLLMQGCGVGFKPVVGTLTGFMKPIAKITTIHSTREAGGGVDDNLETFEDNVWTIKVGDSAEAWAKAAGKLMAGKVDAREVVFDFSEIRPAGTRLKGYGWISSGDESISIAFEAIAQILNRRAGQLLSRIDILDVVNWLGTILSSRRSAEIALFEYNEPEWKEFAVAKKDWWLTNNKQRIQSNNSLLFNKAPSRNQLVEVFDLMEEAGGSIWPLSI